MEQTAKYRLPHSYRTGRRGNDNVRGGSQRNAITSREGTLASQPSKRGGKQQAQQSVNKPPPPQSPLQQQQQRPIQTPPAPPSTPQNGPKQQPEPHTPLHGFNADDVQNLLNSGVATNTPTYKIGATAETAKSGNPWGLKPGMMANNKDFWLELRRQITALQRQQQQASKPPARGG